MIHEKRPASSGVDVLLPAIPQRNRTPSRASWSRFLGPSSSGCPSLCAFQACPAPLHYACRRVSIGHRGCTCSIRRRAALLCRRLHGTESTTPPPSDHLGDRRRRSRRLRSRGCRRRRATCVLVLPRRIRHPLPQALFHFSSHRLLFTISEQRHVARLLRRVPPNPPNLSVLPARCCTSHHALLVRFTEHPLGSNRGHHVHISDLALRSFGSSHSRAPSRCQVPRTSSQRPAGVLLRRRRTSRSWCGAPC